MSKTRVVITIIQTATIAPLLISIHVDPPSFSRGSSHELQSSVQLSQLMMTPTPVCHDLNSVESKLNVGRSWSKQFFTCFRRHTSEHPVTDSSAPLSSSPMDDSNLEAVSWGTNSFERLTCL